jgi:hypothetical protein
LTSEPIIIRITHARDYLASGTDHIEVESIRPKKAYPLRCDICLIQSQRLANQPH